MHLHSYRGCFELERRLYRIDRWRLPVSWGVPLNGVGYAAAALVAVLIAAKLPLLGALLGSVPAPVRMLILPVGVAYALCQVRVDGRSAHGALGALARHRLGARRIVGYKRRSEASLARYADIAFAPDESGSRLRRARLHGPAEVVLAYPARGWSSRGGLVVEQTSQRPLADAQSLSLTDGQRLEIRA